MREKGSGIYFVWKFQYIFATIIRFLLTRTMCLVYHSPTMGNERIGKAQIEVLSKDRVVKPSGESRIESVIQVSATDRETMERTRDLLGNLADLVGGEMSEMKHGPDGNGRVAFSKKTWNSSWTPTGPKPTWANNPENN